ncbi:hypothetical protein [Variovorax paradoxus]|uniref:hypothetical protein n=1 Tax=Variovorax paradoxus TaxID=34073 RepID=UPI003D651D42
MSLVSTVLAKYQRPLMHARDQYGQEDPAGQQMDMFRREQQGASALESATCASGQIILTPTDGNAPSNSSWFRAAGSGPFGENRFMLSPASIYSLCPSLPLATLVKNACCLRANRVEYRTCIEGSESVYIVEIPRTPHMSMFDALIQLMSIELHWLEEWDCAQTTADDAENIVKHWIAPALECCQFRESPVDGVRREIAVRMQSTASLLRLDSMHSAAGVYVNGIHLPHDIPVFPVSSEIIAGVLLRSEWNELEILYTTTDHIGRMTWGTGA